MTRTSAGPVRRGAAALALALALVAAAGCTSGSTGSDVAKAVQNTLETQGYAVDDVSCDGNLDADNDSTTCQVTVKGEDYPLEVRSKGTDGRGINIDLDTADIPKG